MILNQMVKGRSLDATFGALSDPTRRTIVERLTRGDASVGELARPFDISLPAISKHLTVLEEAGLLVRTREGRTRRCRLVDEPIREVLEWIAGYGRFWGGTARLPGAVPRLLEARRGRLMYPESPPRA
jgi:DNA-binding transcriptional ArsR family regulator